MDVRIHDGMLCARTEGRIPKVCLLCGATKDVVRRTQEYPVGASYGASAGAGGGVLGAMVAQSLRGLERSVAAMAIVAIVGVVIVGAWLAHRATPMVSIALPLCTTCDGRWAEGQERRTWFLGVVVLFFALIVLGIALDAMWLLAAGLALVFGLIAFAKLTDQAKRFVAVGFVKREEIGFRLETQIAEKIVERARRREERASRDESEGEPDADATSPAGAAEAPQEESTT